MGSVHSMVVSLSVLTEPIVGKYPDLFTFTDERGHATRRKLVNRPYSMSNILRAEEGIDMKMAN